jgi:putative ABC transport system permease protein
VPIEIVGVVESFRVAPGESPEPRHAIFVGAEPWLTRRLQYVVRTRPGRAPEALADIGRALEARGLSRVSTILPLNARSVTEAATGVGARYAALVMGALMLIVVFLGRVLTSSLVVAERRREIGIRRALGATRLDIVLWFMGARTLPTIVGLALGVGLTYAIASVAEKSAPGMSLSIGPASIAVACVTFGLYGTAGILVPALRAAAVSPREAARG